MTEDEEKNAKIVEIANYEGGFSELEKLALERFARTTMTPIDAFYAAFGMMELRTRINAKRKELARKV
jgi:hypothetical protein